MIGFIPVSLRVAVVHLIGPFAIAAGLAVAAPMLPGDCDGDGIVLVNELVRGVRIALGINAVDLCPAFDRDKGGAVSINELVAAVNAALGGGVPTATATPPSPTRSATPTHATPSPPSATSTATPTELPNPSASPMGPFQEVAASAQGATRLALATLDWSRALDDAATLLPRAATCPGAVTTECAVAAGMATRTTEYTACSTSTASGHTVRRDGTVIERVENATFCATAAVGAWDTVDVSFVGYRQTERHQGATVASLAADLDIHQVGRGTSGCAGADVDEIVSGTFAVTCSASAESWACPPGGLDVTLESERLLRARRSGGVPCNRQVTMRGDLTVDDAETGDHFAVGFGDYTLGLTDAGLGENARATIDGRLSADCLGEVIIATGDGLELAPGSSCPIAGAFDIGRAAAPATFGQRGDIVQAPAIASQAASVSGIGTPADTSVSQQLFRSARGHVYQLLRNPGSGQGLGAEAVQVTTLVGSSASVAECASSADAVSPPQAVAATAGRGVDPALVRKSRRLGSAMEPCFNRNAAGGDGRLCVGTGCTADCTCLPAAACSSFSLVEGTPLSQPSAEIPAAALVTELESLTGACGGFVGRATYRFGSGAPTVESGVCAPAPLDGFRLPIGESVAFVYPSGSLSTFNAGFGGFPVDLDGVNAVGCSGANRVLNRGEADQQSAAAARVRFDVSGTAQLDYDSDDQTDAVSSDCAAGRVFECAEKPPTPTPEPGGHCGALSLPPVLAAPISDSTADHDDDVRGASCGWGGGGGAPDRVFEYTAPSAGLYDVSLQASFDPYLYVRRNRCAEGEAELACDSGSAGGQARVTLDLKAQDTVAIIVDGSQDRGGPFTLDIQRRQPDLVISMLVAPASGLAGGQVSVSAEVINQGDGDAGPFNVEFFYARDASGTASLGQGTIVCRVDGLSAGARTSCVPDSPLAVPLVAADGYAIIGHVDSAAEVAERIESNNVTSEISDVAVVGAELEQQLFRASDGTAYQVVRVIPRTTRTEAERYQLTSIAGGSMGVNDCVTSVASPGGSAIAGVQSNEPLDLSTVRRTGLLRPNDGAIGFEPDGAGRLSLGAGAGAIAVCASAQMCAPGTPTTLVNARQFDADIPSACISASEFAVECAPFFFDQTVAFGFSADEASGQCESGGGTIESQICGLAPFDGFALQPGEALVFVYEPGLQPFSTGVAGFGIDRDGINTAGCTTEQVVGATALRADSGQPSLLTFVENYKRGRLMFTAGAVTHDEQILYAVASEAIFVFRRPSITGDFALQQIVREGEGGVTGLDFVQSIAVSPDDRYLYVAGGDAFFFEDSFLVFRRDDSGLTLIQTLRSGFAGLETFLSGSGLTVSPSGEFVYASTRSGLVVLRRDATTGRLLIIQNPVAPDGFFTDFLRPPALSADGRNIYQGGTCLAVYDRDPNSGVVTPRAQSDDCVALEAIALSPDGSQLYGLGSDGLFVLQRDRNSGALSAPKRIFESAGGSMVSINASGDLVFALGPSQSGSSQDAAEVRTYQRETTTGDLALSDVRTLPGDAFLSRALAIDDSGRSVFVLSEDVRGIDYTPGTIQEFREVDGVLSPHGVLPGPDLPFDGLGGASAAALDSQGHNVYVAARDDSAIVAFARNDASGRLQGIAVYRNGVQGVDGIGGAFEVALSPDDRHCYVAGAEDGSLAVFDRQAGGSLRYRVSYHDGAGQIAIPNNGANIYVGGERILRYLRDLSDGTLTLQQSVSIEDLSASGRIDGVAVSPDGRYLYVLNSFDSPTIFQSGIRIVIAALETGTGSIGESTLVDAQLHSDNTTAPPFGTSIVVSPNGADLSFSWDSGNRLGTAVESFERDPNTGMLERNDGIPYLSVIEPAFTSVAVSASGVNKFATSSNGFVVAASEAGLEFQRELGRVNGLSGASGSAVSPDGRHLYVTAGLDAALTVFRINRPDR